MTEMTQATPLPDSGGPVKVEYNEVGLVLGYGCWSCGAPVKFDSKDDIGTTFYRCEKCGQVNWKLRNLEKEKFLEAMRRSLGDLELSWSGMVVPELDFVLEPLGNGEYVWCHGENKGISKVYESKDEDEKKEETHYTIHVDDDLLQFTDVGKGFRKSFFGELPFRVPRREIVEAWVNHKRESKDVTTLFDEVENYIRLVLDLEQPFESKICAIWIFQTWLRHISEWAGNLDVGGPYGSGKTTLVLALAELCYHAITGTTTPAALARMNEKYGCTWVIDEYDKARRVEESLIDMFIRQGDRRGIPVWRFNPDKGCEESFDPFGPKLIDYHTSLETALKQRSIYHLKMTKSADSRLPIINIARSKFSQRLFEDLFFWYLEHITETKPILPALPELLELPDFGRCLPSAKSMDNGENSNVTHPPESSNSGNSGNVDASRQSLFNLITADMTKPELSVLSRLQARGAELGFIVMRVAKAIGLKDYTDDLKEAFEIKTLEEEEPEYDETAIVREVLLRHIKDGPVKQADIYKEALKLSKEEYDQDLTANKFGRVLRDLGFREKKTIKRKAGGVRWLILDAEIQAKLTSGEGETETTLVSLDDLVEGPYWADSFFGEYECGVCGYRRRTSFRAKTNKGAEIVICEDCKQKFEERREST